MTPVLEGHAKPAGPEPSSRPAVQYGLAVLGIAAATLLRFPLEPWLHGQAPFALYYLPILVTAWYTGVGPTLLATALSLVSARLFFVDLQRPGAAPAMLMFLLVSGAMALMARAGRQIRRERARALATALRHEQAADFAAWEWTREDPVVHSQRLAKLVGLDTGDSTRLRLEQLRGLIHRDDIGEIEQRIREAVRTGAPFRVEFRATHPRGERWLAVVGEVQRDPSGRLERAAGVCLDITERKRADETRAYLAAIVESSDDAIIAKDLEGTIQSINAAAERIFGYPASELVGKPVSVLVPPERQAEEKEMLERLRRGERIDHFETVRLTRDGRPIDVSLTVSPIRDPSGAIIGASKMARDITDRKRTDDALAEQREWLETTLTSIGDAVLAADMDGRVVFMNPVAERLTGWTAAEARGRLCEEVFRIINETTRQPAPNPVRRAIAEGVVVGLANHSVLIAADGTERPIDDSGAPIRNRRGRVAGVVMVFRDISERRRVEVERQTATLDRERLLDSERVARAEAERANRIKDDFMAMVSHELRTPLNAILGWARILLDDPGEELRLRQGLEVIERNTRIQAQLISDLLDISRIVSGKLRLEIQPVSLAVVIDDAVQTVQAAAQAKGIELTREVPDELGPAVGDPARLQQAVWNLLSNAIKFTPKGGRVSVTLRPVDSEAEITVSDNGIGIRADALPYVFERFRQGEAMTTRRFGGLGLGLAIVKQLVELHGGQVRAESAGEGKGASFTLRLPLASARVPALPTLETSGRGAILQDGGSLDNVRVLVVEDDPDTRDLVERLLREHRAEVVTAASAQDALAALAATSPDILVSDIGLPEMDGYELIQTIRRRDAAAGGRIPAVALTAFARSEDRTRALRAGYQAHVAKPVEPAELVATVASIADLISKRKNEASGS
jgi:PAS domain S-box-containing protein